MVKRKAYAKINLALDITGKRDDGYHELRTVMQTINIFDVLTFAKNPGAISPITIRVTEDSTIKADLGRPEDNLIYKAASLVMKSNNVNTPVIITLKKNIPVAAGLAGGSSDAAATIRGLNDLLNLKMSFDDMCKLGVKVGADVPFCIMGGTVLAEGIGDKLKRLPNPPQCYLLIAKPDISVSTASVYQEYDKLKDVAHPDVDSIVDGILNQDLLQISHSLGNVLEDVTVPKHPVIENIKETMKDMGAWNSLMSGSGPTVFGVFMDHLMAGKAEKHLVESGLAANTYVTTYMNNADI